VNRHNRISHFYGDYRRFTAEIVLEALEFDSPPDAMRWLVAEFVDIDLDWRNLNAGSPYPIGLPVVVRIIENALRIELELVIGAAWGGLSLSQRKTADRNFRKVFGSPELLQGSNSEYCSKKFEKWLVLVEDGVPALDASQEEIRARAAAICASQEQVSLQRRLTERSNFIENFYAKVETLQQEIGKMSASELAKGILSTFFKKRYQIREHSDFDRLADGYGIYYDLAEAHPPAVDLVQSAVLSNAESRDSELTATLLLLVWGRHPPWSALVDAGLAHPDMAATLEQSSPQAARWWRSVVRGQRHRVRLVSHWEYNRRRTNYLKDLASRTGADRLRRIIEDDDWHLGALPPEYADTAALTGLSDAERAALKRRLMRAPSGPWSSLKKQLCRP
jgi:hypothetical protein